MVKTDLTFIETQTDISNVYSKGNSNPFTMILDEQFWFLFVCGSCLLHEIVYLTWISYTAKFDGNLSSSGKMFIENIFGWPLYQAIWKQLFGFLWKFSLDIFSFGRLRSFSWRLQFWLYDSLRWWISLSLCWEFSKLEENWAEMDFSC